MSPTEIEDVLRSHPGKLIADVSVAGVSGGRTKDEKVPRAWVVLSEEGRKKPEVEVLEELDSWVMKNLSTYKWLRGGVAVVPEVWTTTWKIFESYSRSVRIVDPEVTYGESA